MTLFEISMPLFFAVLFLLLRFNIKITPKNEATLYDDFPVTTNGTVFDLKGTDLGNIILYTPNTTLLNNLMAQVETDMGVKLANGKSQLGFKELLHFENVVTLSFFTTDIFTNLVSMATTILVTTPKQVFGRIGRFHLHM